MQTFADAYSAAFAGEIRVPMNTLAPMAMGERKIIARRAALELQPQRRRQPRHRHARGRRRVAAEERIIDLLTLTAEPGVIGGVPAGGLNFGAAINAQAIIDQPYQFDFYDGGGLDLAFLGLAAGRRRRATSTSAASGRGWPAPAASSTSARTPSAVVFVGTFTAGGLRGRGRGRAAARSCRRARQRKFVREVEHRTFSGALRRGSAASRCSTSPSAACSGSSTDGLELIEVAPGIDIERDILAHMDFAPLIRDAAAADGRAHLRRRADGPARALLDDAARPALRPTTPTATCSSSTSSGSACARRRTSRRIRRHVANSVEPLGHKVYAIVNYDNFEIAPEVGRRLRGDGQGAGRRATTGRHALHHIGLPAHEARRGAGARAASRRTSTSRPTRR